MKKTQEILGLPIISISDAIEKGKVKGIVTNADKGAVDYIIVDSGVQVIGMRVISTEDVLGIGEYALTIEDEKSIIDIESVPQAVELLRKDVQIKNTRVMTKKGRLIGETGDYYVNEDDVCGIAGLEFLAQAGGSVRIIPRKNVITFGKNLIVVSEDAESSLVNEIESITEETVDLEKKNLTFTEEAVSDKYPVQQITDETEAIPQIGELPQQNSFASIEVPEVEEVIEEPIPVVEEEPAEVEIEEVAEEEPVEVETEEAVEEEPVSETISIEEVVDEEQQPETEEKPQPSVSNEGGAASLFEQRQRQYLKGRHATKTITDASGNVLVEDGTIITDDIIDSVKACGKMIELVMNNKA